MPSERDKATRRWRPWQFSLRASLVVISVVCLMAWILSPNTYDLSRFQGTWTVESRTIPRLNNKPVSDPIRGYDFRGNTMVEFPGGDEAFQITLFPDEKRIHAFVAGDSEAANSPYNEGYYYVNDDTLKICFVERGLPGVFVWGPDGDFPKQFAAHTYALLVLKRSQTQSAGAP